MASVYWSLSSITQFPARKYTTIMNHCYRQLLWPFSLLIRQVGSDILQRTKASSDVRKTTIKQDDIFPTFSQLRYSPALPYQPMVFLALLVFICTSVAIPAFGSSPIPGNTTAVFGDTEDLNHVLNFSSPEIRVTHENSNAFSSLAMDTRDPLRRFSLSADRDILSENVGETTVTVTAQLDTGQPFTTPQTLTITVRGSGTASAVDFAPVANFNIVIAANESSGSATFSLTPEDDSVDEVNETVTISSTSSLVTGTATISLLDDDPAPTGISLNATPNVARENEGEQTFTVTATVDGRTTYGAAQSIPITIQGTLADGVVDFAPVPDFRITIAGGASSGNATFNLTPENDSVDEADETITISSSSALVTNSINFLLRDDDATPRGINLQTNTNAVYENLGAQDIEIYLEISGLTTYASDQIIPISVTGAGTPGAVDFAPVADFNITLPAEATSSARSTFTITPTNNLIDEVNETITVSSSASQVTGPATINLVDDDDAPGEISLTASPSVIGEGDGETSVTVTASIGSQTTFGTSTSIPIVVEGSGNTNVVGFTSASGFSIVFPPATSTSTATLIVTPVDDSEMTEDEEITLSSTNPAVTGSATITLINDDGEPIIELSTTPSSVSENSGATTITVTATVQNLETRPEDLTIPLTVTGSGRAGAVDFVPVPDFNLILNGGTTTGSATFSLSPLNDSQDESDEVITIASTQEFVTNSATITLVDDDETPGVSLNASPNSVREDAGATEITVTATVIGSTQFGSAQVLPLMVTGSDVPAAVDFTPVADFNLTIAAGSSGGSANFTLTPEDDIENEVDERVTIGSSSSLITQNATVTIIDDDAPVQIQLSVNPDAVYEEQGSQTITVTGTLASGSTFAEDRDISLSFRGSGKATAVDFVPIPDATLNFKLGLTVATTEFDVIPVDDQEFESDETITVSSTDPTVDASVVVRLINDDAEPEGVILTASPNRIREDAGATKVTVTATVRGNTRYPTSQNIALDITDDDDSNAVGYLPISGVVLTIPAGAAEGTAVFEIVPENDTAQQPNAMITVGSDNSLVLEEAVIILEDDDTAPTGITLSITPSSILESDGPTSLTLEATVQGGTTFIAEQTLLITAEGTGEAGAVDFAPIPDFELTIPAKSINASTVVEVIPEDDTRDEQDEIVTFSTKNSLVTQAATLKIVDDDATPSGIAVSLTPNEVAEDAGETEVIVTVRVMGDTRYATDRLLNLSSTGSGMPGVVGFMVTAPSTLLLPAGQDLTTTTITVDPENDSLDEENETLTITASDDGIEASADISLVDDDAEPTGITVSLNPNEIVEDAGKTEVTVTVRVTGETRYATDRSLTLTSTGSGMSGVVGYMVTAPTTLLLPAGQDHAVTTIIVEPENNLFDEENEKLTITVGDDDIESSATLSLVDDDTEPTGFTLAVTPEIVIEGDGPTSVNVTATITGNSRYITTQTLSLSVSESTDESVGYEKIPDFMIEVPAGAKTGSNSFTLTPSENTVPEMDATIVITALHEGEPLLATLLLQDDDQSTKRITDVNVTLLPEATRAIIASSVGAISERIQTFKGGASIHSSEFSDGLSRIATRFQNDHSRRYLSESIWSSILNNTSLAVGIKERITVWGSANYRNLSGNHHEHPLSYDGGISGIHAGVDMSFGEFLVGVSVSRFGGDLNYEHSGGTDQLALTTPVKGLYHINARTFSPYVTWYWNSRSKAWAMGSLGAGNVEISDPDATSEDANTSLIAYAAGVNLGLITNQNGFSLAAKGAAWGGQMDLDKNTSRIRELDAYVYRFQVSLEGAYQIRLANQGSLKPFVETGLRGDGGDGQTGAGLEVGGGARLSIPSLGLRVTGQGHVLVLHGGNINEWGFGGQVSYAPGGNSGPTLELQSTTGNQFQNAQEIWRDTRWLAQRRLGIAATRLQSRVGYGLTTKYGTITPYTGMDFGHGMISQVGTEYRTGRRLSIRMEGMYQIRSSAHKTPPSVRALIILK